MKRFAMLSLAATALLIPYAAGMGQVDGVQDAEARTDNALPVDNPLTRWMHAKSSAGQQMFVSLAKGDFEQLETQARRMQVLNFLEQWARETDFQRKSEYQGQLNAFDFATKELIRHARDRNIDGSLNSYIALTKSCVRCHTLIRDVPQSQAPTTRPASGN